MSDRERLLAMLTDINDDIAYETETAIIDDGLLNSLEILSIVAEMKEQFGISIRVSELEPENFNSVDAMLELIEAKRGGK